LPANRFSSSIPLALPQAQLQQEVLRQVDRPGVGAEIGEPTPTVSADIGTKHGASAPMRLLICGLSPDRII
jgi:hypothetical protein